MPTVGEDDEYPDNTPLILQKYEAILASLSEKELEALLDSADSYYGIEQIPDDEEIAEKYRILEQLFKVYPQLKEVLDWALAEVNRKY
jgi:hypothetical protein